MKKYLVPLFIGLVFMLTPVLAIGASFTGSVQGLNCVLQGIICPIGQEDPIAAAENVFVLLVDAATQTYYFVPNVDRVVMARHIAEEVTIEGTLDAKKKAIKANKISRKGKLVWSTAMQTKAYKTVWGFDPFGGEGALGRLGRDFHQNIKKPPL